MTIFDPTVYGSTSVVVLRCASQSIYLLTDKTSKSFNAVYQAFAMHQLVFLQSCTVLYAFAINKLVFLKVSVSAIYKDFTMNKLAFFTQSLSAMHQLIYLQNLSVMYTRPLLFALIYLFTESLSAVYQAFAAATQEFLSLELPLIDIPKLEKYVDNSFCVCCFWIRKRFQFT